MSENPSLLSSSYKPAEDEQELNLRPRLLRDFQGQSQLKENLAVFIKAAKMRGDCLDHLFLSGPPGLGKTTLAQIMANEMGAEFKPTSAPALEKPKDLAGILSTISAGSVFFIDEIHRLRPAMEEMLYIAMEDFEIDWIIGQGPAARTLRIPIPHFTLIGATTKAGHVAGPLFNRFGITFRMEFYTREEIVRIIIRSAEILGVEITEKGAAALGKCSRGTPRVANRLLRRMRDFAQVIGEGKITDEIVNTGLKRLSIDGYGLEKHDREILEVIIKKYQGGPVGAETLAISVGEGVESLEDFYEPYLITMGFLKRTHRGRVATPLAYEHLGLELNSNNGNQGLLL